MLSRSLNTLEPISLPEMENVKLMDRIDTKYVFNVRQLPLFLDTVKETYRVLEINSNRIFKYESVYFDTKDFDLYRQHHRGKLNRYKIRFRKYVESDLTFFEIKLRSNQGRTIKSRINYGNSEETLSDKAREFLERTTRLSAENYGPVMRINHNRITLVNRFSPERVTIDTNLNFRYKDSVEQIHNLVVAEVKQDSSRQSSFVRLMKQQHIRKGFMSKYCFGISSLVEGIGKNNFKQQLNQFHKLQRHAAAGIE